MNKSTSDEIARAAAMFSRFKGLQVLYPPELGEAIAHFRSLTEATESVFEATFTKLQAAEDERRWATDPMNLMPLFWSVASGVREFRGAIAQGLRELAYWIEV